MRQAFIDRNRLWARLSSAVAAHGTPLPTPTMVVDLDAFDANADDLVRRAGGKPIRVASKSLRVPALMERALAHEGFHGVLAYTLREALWLHEHDVSDDIVVAYPTVDRGALADLVGSPSAAAHITLMVDDRAHLDLVDSVRASLAVPVRIAIDVDAGLWVKGQHVGPKRSPLHDVAPVVELARAVEARGGFRLVGAMTYEGQVAGLPDRVPARRARSLVVRGMKAMSLTQLEDRRRQIDEALRQVASLEFWNAGGSGSIEQSAHDHAVTEVAAGSGLFGPTLFDAYSAFRPQPAAFFVLPVVRKPSAGVATVLGGGYPASGTAEWARLPSPHLPAGLKLDRDEGAGEVQTPLLGAAADGIAIGDRVYFRHAKAGELCERVDVVHLIRGGELVDSVPTYRGEGKTFL